MKDDPQAFIFTLKNYYGVEPTRFMKRKESGYAIGCYPNYGPMFYDGKSSADLYIYDNGADLYISDNCNCNKESYTYNDGRGYDCHPEYKMSLFVNTNDPDKENHFYVSDYEVFTHN